MSAVDLSHSPQEIQIHDRLWKIHDDLIAKLALGRMSYGEFNTTAAKADVESNSALRQLQTDSQSYARSREQACLQNMTGDRMALAQCRNYARCGQYPIDSGDAARCYADVSHNILFIRRAEAEARREQQMQNAIDAANARAADAARRAMEEGYGAGYDEGYSEGQDSSGR